MRAAGGPTRRPTSKTEQVGTSDANLVLIRYDVYYVKSYRSASLFGTVHCTRVVKLLACDVAWRPLCLAGPPVRQATSDPTGSSQRPAWRFTQPRTG